MAETQIATFVLAAIISPRGTEFTPKQKKKLP